MNSDLIGLFKTASGSIEGITGLDREVWRAIGTAGGKRWRIGDEIVGGRRLLVGIASYSKVDLELAERLLSLPRIPDLVIEFFNVLDVRDMSGFDDYIPGIGNVWGTPVVGLWRGGSLERAVHGAEGQRLIRSEILVEART